MDKVSEKQYTCHGVISSTVCIRSFTLTVLGIATVAEEHSHIHSVQPPSAVRSTATFVTPAPFHT